MECMVSGNSSHVEVNWPLLLTSLMLLYLKAAVWYVLRGDFKVADMRRASVDLDSTATVK